MIVHDRIRPGRRIAGMSAVLLPFTADGEIDWMGFEAHVGRTVAAGLTPAVNMDTGFGPWLDATTRAQVLARSRPLAPGGFVAGVHVTDEPGAGLDLDAYRRELALATDAGATPILFPSFGMASVPDAEVAAAHAAICRDADRVLGFELGTMFHPAGRIWSSATFAEVLEVEPLVGAKHSSLDRSIEWDRLATRDAVRPDFQVLTGNDLAIDMVVYGSDYLLGLSTFAPDAFAMRDRAWLAGDEPRFWAINDVLQHLGRVAFRPPVPGYRHDAAMFLAARGLIDCDATHPRSPGRPASDRELLVQVIEELRALGAIA